MAVKIFISLEGGDNVQKQIDAIGKSLGALGKTDLNKGLNFSDVNIQFANASKAMGDAAQSSGTLAEGIHLLRPALNEAGLALGSVRELSILARAGIEGLGIALGATLVVAAAKATDAVTTLQKGFQFLFGSTGTNALDGLKKSADELNVSTSALGPALQPALDALKQLSSFKGIAVGGEVAAFGSPKQIEDVTNAWAALVRQLEVLGQTGTVAAAAVGKAFADISKLDPKTLKPVGLTKDTFLQLKEQAPEVAQAIANAFRSQQGADLLTTLQKHAVDFLTIMRVIAASKVAIDIKPIDPNVAQSLEGVKIALEKVLEGTTTRGQVPAFLGSLREAVIAIGPLIQGVVRNIASLGTTVAQFFRDLGNLGTAIGSAFKTGDFSVALNALKTLVSDLASNLVNGVKNAFGGLPANILAFFQGVDWGAAFTNLITAARALPTQIVEFFKSIDFTAAFANLDSTLGNLPTRVLSFFKDIDWGGAWIGLLDAETRALEQAGSALLSGINSIISTLASISWSGVFQGLLDAGNAVIQSLTNAFTTFLNWLKSQSLSVGGGSLGGGFELPAGGAAGGGYIRGPGTSTSDSILAWLSDREFVVKASAVSHYGVDLMHAINSMRLPKDFFRGFNMGGLVMPAFPSPPRFAQGGLAVAGQSRSLTLVLDGKSFAMSGSRNVVDELEKAADLHNLSRIGRAPGWVR